MTYSGHANKGRFQEGNFSREGIRNQQARDSRAIQSKRTANEFQQRSDSQYLTAWAQRNKDEAASRAANFKAKQNNEDEILKGHKLNYEIEANNLTAQAEIDSSLLKSIDSLSQTAGKEIGRRRKKWKEEETEKIYWEAYMGPIPQEEMVQSKLAQTELQVTSAGFEMEADAMRESGTPEIIAKGVRQMSGWRGVAQARGQMARLADDIPTLLLEKQDEIVDLGPENGGKLSVRQAISQQNWDAVAAIRDAQVFDLSRGFIKQGISRAMVAEHFYKDARQQLNSMRGTDLQAREKAAQKNLQRERNVTIQDSLDRGYNGPQTWAVTLNTLFGNRSEGITQMFGNIKTRIENGSITDPIAYVDQLLDQQVVPLGPGGSEIPLREAYATNPDMADVIQAANKGAQDQYTRNQNNIKRKMNEYTTKALQLAASDGTTNEEIDLIRSTLIDTATKNGYNPSIQLSILDNAKKNSIESINQRVAIEGLEASAATLELTTEEVRRAGLSATETAKWLRVAADQTELNNQGGGGLNFEKAAREALSSALKLGGSTTTTAHYSIEGALAEAKKLYGMKYTELMESGKLTPYEASNRASLEVMNQIQEGAQGKNNSFYVIDGVDTKDNRSFFRAFTAGSHNGQFDFQDKYITTEQLNKDLQDIKDDQSLLNEKNFFSVAQLTKINRDLKNGKPVRIPSYFRNLERATGIKAEEALNMQLAQAGLEGQLTPGGHAQAFREKVAVTPGLTQLLGNWTINNVNTAVISTGSAPVTVRKGKEGYYDIQNLGAINQFKAPNVMAAMWALESGYGESQSGKHNYFNIKAEPGQGTMMPSPEGDGRVYDSWWRDYNSPNESAQDFIALMGDARYAEGLAMAETPRQAIQAIIDAGYATDPNYVNKVVNILKSYGVNPDGPLMVSTNPNRNPNNMSPTLQHVYTADNIGPTSTGQHTDVKQMDNPRTKSDEYGGYFPPNRLDKFVVVDDPKLGKVPLGKIPTTDGFGSPRNYGVHSAWDFGTYTGSKIYLKNGARVISSNWTEHGERVIIEIPDGTRFRFLHGKGVNSQ